MAGPLVETKLFMPKVRRLVARPRMSERLAHSSGARLTLISAPAGFGKTTLLSAWLAASENEQRSVAWLSLEESDSRPEQFWTYAITALQTVVPGIGAEALPLLQSGQAPIETVLTTLLNELTAVPRKIFLVLDDYHLVDGPDIGAGMVFLLEHLPPHVHLVISGRADPALPLARLRARGELIEVRAADLRFTLAEVTDYLHQVAGLDLTGRDIAVLAGRTEGWIAALQLAALSMQGRSDVAGFIAGFAGDDRYIVDYLVEEVLRRQPEHVRGFLIRTSILDRLSGPLCDAVTAQPGGRAMLESLDRANLFVVPLDDNRHWYRYHHLFADVLRTRLPEEHAGEAADLHRRASDWYDRNGEPVPAVRHALAAGDVERAAGLIELAIPALLRNRQEPTVRGWVDVLPDAVVRVRPMLAIGLIGALMQGGELAGVEARLRDVESVLARTPAAAEFSHLPGMIQMYRAALALSRGDTSATIGHARLAIDRAAADDDLTRAGASALSGLAGWSNGDLEAAHQAYSAAVDGLRRAGNISDVLGCSIALADIRITQGRLGEAMRTYEQALAEGEMLRGAADMHTGMSLIALERNDLAAATRHLLRGQELGERAGLPQNPYRRRVAMARVRQSQGDLAGALQLLGEAERVYTGDFLPNVRPVPAMTARLLAEQGRIAEALSWAREQGLSADDELSYLREFEHITLARILLARHASDPTAAGLLERLLAAAEAGQRTGSVIEILVLQSLATQAVAPLERALALAEPEGYVRVFVGAGPPMASLLRAATKRPYVRRLLTAYGQGGDRHAPGLVEPLSPRELEVLRLLGTVLDGPAIARELLVSLNTLRTHTRNIYAKLGVTNRRAAVRQAAELNLLPGTRER